MSSDLPTKYDQITAEEEATIDAICDRFEQAWREAGAGGLKPSAANYVVDCQGAAREVLIQELVALEQACQERYGENPEYCTTINRRIRAGGDARRRAAAGRLCDGAGPYAAGCSGFRRYGRRIQGAAGEAEPRCRCQDPARRPSG